MKFWISDLQREVLTLVDTMINEGKTFEEISNYLYNNKFYFRVETKNGYTSKTRFEVCKDVDGKTQYSFVDLIKRRNGLAYWETYKIS